MTGLNRPQQAKTTVNFMGLKYVGLFTKIPTINKRRKWQTHFTLLFITVGKMIYQTDGLDFFPVNSDLTYCSLPPTFDRRLIKRWSAGWMQGESHSKFFNKSWVL